MKKLSLAVLAAAILSVAAISTTTTPANALGACGPNRHRDRFGHCVFGGQNQNYCLRHTGHVAARGPRGTRWCR